MIRASAIIILAALSLLINFSTGHAAEQAETERLIKTITPPLAVLEAKEVKRDEVYADGYLEQSDILQGSRTGHWTEITTRYGYIHRNIQGYLSISQLTRFDDKDFTANLGSYLSLKDSYAHLEAGFGWLTDYMYKFQSIIEYGHRAYKDLFWQVGYSYRLYDPDDTHLVYPGLVYYFGDSYISADYGVSYIETRDTAHFGAVKGSFAITKFLRWGIGLAFGQRLYDIFALDAKEEFGYIGFTALQFNIYKGINGRVGVSYGAEKPKFIKRSLDFALSAKF